MKKVLRTMALMALITGFMTSWMARPYSFTVNGFNYSQEHAIRSVSINGVPLLHMMLDKMEERTGEGEKGLYKTGQSGPLCCVELKREPKPGERVEVEIQAWANRPGKYGDSFFPVKTWAYWPTKVGADTITVHIYPNWHVELEGVTSDEYPVPRTTAKASDKPIIGEVVIDPNELTEEQWKQKMIELDERLKRQDEIWKGKVGTDSSKN